MNITVGKMQINVEYSFIRRTPTYTIVTVSGQVVTKFTVRGKLCDDVDYVRLLCDNDTADCVLYGYSDRRQILHVGNCTLYIYRDRLHTVDICFFKDGGRIHTVTDRSVTCK